MPELQTIFDTHTEADPAGVAKICCLLQGPFKIQSRFVNGCFMTAITAQGNKHHRPMLSYFANCSMEAYKVVFNNGQAIAAEAINPALYKTIVGFSKKGDVQYVDWYVVECEDREKAMQVANDVVNAIWGKAWRQE